MSSSQGWVVVSPIGIGVSAFWKAALAGQSGISAITSFDPFPMDGYRSKVAGQVHDFAVERFIDSVHGERVDRYAQFALVAAKEALADSGLQMEKENPHRVGVIVGAGMGGMVMGEREITQLYSAAETASCPSELYSRHHPQFGIRHYRDGLRRQGPQLDHLYRLLLQRPCTWTSAPLYPRRPCRCCRLRWEPTPALLRSSSPDFAPCVPSRQNSTIIRRRPLGLSIARETVSLWERVPGRSSWNRPHMPRNARRKSMPKSPAMLPPARPIIMVIPREDGMEVAHTMRLALADAGVTPAQVDYINAHATSTTIGDAVEVKAIRQLFRSRADKIAISATKSLIGHTLGAAGSNRRHRRRCWPFTPARFIRPPTTMTQIRLVHWQDLSRSAQERRLKGGLAECIWVWQQQCCCGIQTGNSVAGLRQD